MFSIHKVREELMAGNDQLAEWAADHDESFFLPFESRLMPALTKISEWVHSPEQKYESNAVYSFLESADLFLIAYAMTDQRVVVTHEQPSDTRRKVKIPNVCLAMGVEYMETFQMLLDEAACFVLEETADKG